MLCRPPQAPAAPAPPREGASGPKNGPKPTFFKSGARRALQIRLLLHHHLLLYLLLLVLSINLNFLLHLLFHLLLLNIFTRTLQRP